MGAVIVRSPPPSESLPQTIPGTVISIGTNTPILPPPPGKSLRHSAEIHAELSAISHAARKGISLDGAEIYITFPPCKDCFIAILNAGIKKIAYRKTLKLENAREVARFWGVELEDVDDLEADLRSIERVNACVQRFYETNPPDSGGGEGFSPLFRFIRKGQ
ncbi:hypothetical protein HK097_002848 [Rhizophlyctis rosea]|uniref:CMP/dCMP-type deaminase domain-containing protein n=1 Tax=Rhizophlyctis rosea TaxID=64517 RepID=A0AAD5SGP0_9FUNG|nr:hypothetical protein HK097_002848 [Rhizophlyctis rosea]